MLEYRKHRTRQPQGSPSVDWSNPLTRGLVSLIDPASGADLVATAPVTYNGTVNRPASRLGVAVSASTNKGAGAVAGGATGVSTGPLTDFVFVAAYTAVGSGSTFIYGCGTYDGGSNGCGIALEHGTISYRWGAVDIGSNLASSLASSGEALPSEGGFLVHSRDGATHRLYRNGALRASVSGTSGNASATSKFVACNLVATAGTFSTTAPIALAGRFNRALSDAEVEELSANPWQLFQPRRIWVPQAAAAGTTVDVPAGSLSLTGYAPSVVAPQSVSVPAAALTLSAYAPVVSTPVLVGVPSATITLTGFAPVVVNPRTISVPAASLTLTGYAPDVSTGGAGTTIAIPAGALTLSAFAPTVATTAVIAIPSGSLTLTAYAPTVSDGTGVPTIVSVSLGTLTLTGFAPRVSDGSAPLGQKLDEYPRLPSDPYQISQKVTSLFSLTNTRVNELSTGSLWANYNAVSAQPASTEGAWGDVRKNARPKELGSPGSKYVIVGWVRLEDDYVPMRVLTGN